MGKDYYKILGVDKNSSSEDIKKAFRKLAHQYHPDKAGGDEAKFKEINEAYQVLGNADKKQQYDQYGSTFDQQGGFGGGMNWNDFMSRARGGGFNNMNFDFGDMDLGDMFGDFFGFGGKKEKHSRGRDIQVDMTITLSECALGADKEIELYQRVDCRRCGGTGAEPGTSTETCGTCGGRGRVTRVQQTFIGAIQTSAVCPECRGEGKKIKTPCSACGGEGAAKEKVKIKIQIPAGIEDGAAIKLNGRGEAAGRGGTAGDLYVVIKIKNDARFERDGADLKTVKKIFMVEAALGAKVEVETLNGVIDLKIPEGTQPGALFRVRGAGLAAMNSGRRGDLFVEIEVEIPKKLTRKQREALESAF